MKVFLHEHPKEHFHAVVLLILGSYFCIVPKDKELSETNDSINSKDICFCIYGFFSVFWMTGLGD